MSADVGARRAMHWVAVGGVSLLALFTVRVVADQFGDKAPALRSFVNYLNASEGA
jgi:hypothetical protein